MVHFEPSIIWTGLDDVGQFDFRGKLRIDSIADIRGVSRLGRGIAGGIIACRAPQNWITPWVSRYAASSTFLRILERASGTEREGQSNDLLSASDQEFLSIVQRIGAIEIFNRIMKQPGVASEPSQVWRVTQDAERDITYAVGRGKQSQLRIDYVNSSRQSEWERVLIAMLLLLISITLIFRSRFRRWAVTLSSETACFLARLKPHLLERPREVCD